MDFSDLNKHLAIMEKEYDKEIAEYDKKIESLEDDLNERDKKIESLTNSLMEMSDEVVTLEKQVAILEKTLEQYE
jgi:septal ring factor EnvC (AmiA/AmiB activator)